jgi:hypothetical protein
MQKIVPFRLHAAALTRDGKLVYYGSRRRMTDKQKGTPDRLRCAFFIDDSLSRLSGSRRQLSARYPDRASVLHGTDAVVPRRGKSCDSDLQRVTRAHRNTLPEQHDSVIERIAFHDPGLANRLRTRANRKLISRHGASLEFLELSYPRKFSECPFIIGRKRPGPSEVPRDGTNRATARRDQGSSQYDHFTRKVLFGWSRKAVS